MEITPYLAVNQFLSQFLPTLKASFSEPEQVVGVYLHGSLVLGDFDSQVSDIDLLVVLQETVLAHEFEALHLLHETLLATYPEWRGRLDINYLSQEALRTFKTQPSPMALLTPGEDFHMLDAGADWLLSWYPVRQYSLALYGPPAEQIIAPIDRSEFIQAVKAHVWDWEARVMDDDKKIPQSYLTLLLCRALYTCETGEQTSKIKAAQWAITRLPSYTALIEDALQYRFPWWDQPAEYSKRQPATRDFYQYIAGKLK